MIEKQNKKVYFKQILLSDTDIQEINLLPDNQDKKAVAIPVNCLVSKVPLNTVHLLAAQVFVNFNIKTFRSEKLYKNNIDIKT